MIHTYHWLIYFCVLVLALPSLTRISLSAQTGASTSATRTKSTDYDIVSVKINKSGSGNMSVDTGEATYTAKNASIKTLLSTAYGIKEDLIYGVSGPVSSARFDLEAKIVNPDLDELKQLTPEQQQSRLRPVLANRFQLRAHTEARTLPVYELILAKGGPKFKLTSPTDSPGHGEAMTIDNGVLNAHGISLASLAYTLSYQLHRTILDKTGLKGIYDLSLTWTPDSGSDASPETSAASIFTALQEQLGLKLQSGRGPVAVLVIDHIELPSEN